MTFLAIQNSCVHLISKAEAHFAIMADRLIQSDYRLYRMGKESTPCLKKYHSLRIKENCIHVLYQYTMELTPFKIVEKLQRSSKTFHTVFA